MRCIICDYCSETGYDDHRAFYWSKKDQGYICGNCNEAIWKNRNEISISKDESEDGEVAHLVGFELLEFDDVEEYLKEIGARRSGSAKEEPDFLSDDIDSSE